MRANDCLWWVMPEVTLSVGIGGSVTRPSGVWVAKCCNRETPFPPGGPIAYGWTTCPYCGGYLTVDKPGA